MKRKVIKYPSVNLGESFLINFIVIPMATTTPHYFRHPGLVGQLRNLNCPSRSGGTRRGTHDPSQIPVPTVVSAGSLSPLGSLLYRPSRLLSAGQKMGVSGRPLSPNPLPSRGIHWCSLGSGPFSSSSSFPCRRRGRRSNHHCHRTPSREGVGLMSSLHCRGRQYPRV